jgi:hypothetical protein
MCEVLREEGLPSVVSHMNFEAESTNPPGRQVL